MTHKKRKVTGMHLSTGYREKHRSKSEKKCRLFSTRPKYYEENSECTYFNGPWC